MHILHDIGSYYSMEISFHKVKHEINIFWVFRFDDIEKTDNIGMAVELLEKDNLN